MPYIGLFLAIRSENWELRMASLKSMAADLTAFDHPIYQKLITRHIVDIFSFPKVLLEYFKKSVSGKIYTLLDWMNAMRCLS